MKKYFAISIILLTAAVASGFPSPNERFIAALDKITSIQSALEKDRSSARQNKDAILFACINDASHQVYAATKQLEGRYSNPSDHDATVAEEVYARIATIQSQASLCQGNTLTTSFEGTKVSTSIDSSMAPVTPDVSNPPLIIEPPNCASCFR
jgi:hypothetical protein